MKETAIVECIGDNKVSVMLYDEEDSFVGSPVEVMTEEEAKEKYQLVGEIVDGEIKLFKEQNDFDTNDDYSDTIDDDDD